MSVGVVEVLCRSRCRSLVFVKLVVAEWSLSVQGSLEKRTQSRGRKSLELHASLEGVGKRAVQGSLERRAHSKGHKSLEMHASLEGVAKRAAPVSS